MKRAAKVAAFTVIALFLSIPLLSRFRELYPNRIICGRVILQPEEALSIAAKSIVSWPKAPLGGLSPAEYVRNPSACCSAKLSKGLPGNWDVTIALPTECGTTEEFGFAVHICGGGVSLIGSSPSSSDETIISSRLSPDIPSDADTRNYCRSGKQKGQ